MISHNKKHTKRDVREHFKYNNVPCSYQGKRKVMWVGVKDPSPQQLESAKEEVKRAKLLYPDTGFVILARGCKVPEAKS